MTATLSLGSIINFWLFASRGRAPKVIDNIALFVAEPYATWDEGILEVCSSMADRHRMPAVLQRLERTAERLALSAEDLCILALVSPVNAPVQLVRPGPTEALIKTGPDQPKLMTEWGLRLTAAADAAVAPLRAREEKAEAAFGPSDPRRILANTLWGVVASVWWMLQTAWTRRIPSGGSVRALASGFTRHPYFAGWTSLWERTASESQTCCVAWWLDCRNQASPTRRH